jgi:hypothetical protein
MTSINALHSLGAFKIPRHRSLFGCHVSLTQSETLTEVIHLHLSLFVWLPRKRSKTKRSVVFLEWLSLVFDYYYYFSIFFRTIFSQQLTHCRIHCYSGFACSSHFVISCACADKPYTRVFVCSTWAFRNWNGKLASSFNCIFAKCFSNCVPVIGMFLFHLVSELKLGGGNNGIGRLTSKLRWRILELIFLRFLICCRVE